ncbi:NAD-dependent epimerase/dehydratase family protein [Streptomyces sp. NBC_00203]|uniref:NAD-dependent epimerase/dehydratase family protein n=1 Tax=Streptomyces sp. NBC_00203 TaxID=2975680 RepID=UPI003247FFCE
MRGRDVVVLGATGFLGRHIADAFEAAGDRVLRVSRSAPPGAPGRRAAIDLAAATTAELAAFLAAHRPDVVVNAAGTVWQADERRMRELNDAFVRRLVAALPQLPWPVRLVQLGSVHEYGPAPAGVPLTEDREPAPTGTYGRTKLSGTRWVLGAAQEGLDAVVVRVANACGPGAPPESLLGKVAVELARQADRRDPAGELRLSPLRARRDFVDVRDVADAVVAAAGADRGAAAGRIVNVGRGEAVPVRRLVDRMVTLSGLPVRLVEQEAPDGTRAAPEWQQTDIALAGRLLSWRPRRELDESLRDLLAAV